MTKNHFRSPGEGAGGPFIAPVYVPFRNVVGSPDNWVRPERLQRCGPESDAALVMGGVQMKNVKPCPRLVRADDSDAPGLEVTGKEFQIPFFLPLLDHFYPELPPSA